MPTTCGNAFQFERAGMPMPVYLAVVSRTAFLSAMTR